MEKELAFAVAGLFLLLRCRSFFARWHATQMGASKPALALAVPGCPGVVGGIVSARRLHDTPTKQRATRCKRSATRPLTSSTCRKRTT